MGRLDRRDRLALDEAYRYYKSLETGAEPTLFQLSGSLNTVSTALAVSAGLEFKLTRQLWKRLQETLFEAYLTRFAGLISIEDASGRSIEVGQTWPSDGWVVFRPHGCKRIEDSARIEVHRLYPRTFVTLQKLWGLHRRQVKPTDFAAVDGKCENGVCMVRPFVLGHEVLVLESKKSKEEAYQRWWSLYWQAYCRPRKQDREPLYRSMSQIEAVWGDLYY